MKLYILAVLCFATFVSAEDKYTTKYDGVNLDEILKSDRLFNNYYKCLMDQGRCTPDGKLFCLLSIYSLNGDSNSPNSDSLIKKNLLFLCFVIYRNDIQYFTQFGHMAELSECELVMQKTIKKRYFA
jgi:hypothetical protein